MRLLNNNSSIKLQLPFDVYLTSTASTVPYESYLSWCQKPHMNFYIIVKTDTHT